MNRATCLRALAAAIAAVQRDHPTRVALDGVDGAGKTMLADELAEPLERLGRTVIRASVDGFHRPRVERCRRGAESADGYYLDSFDYRAVAAQLLQPLGPGGHRWFRRATFDYGTDCVVESPPSLAGAHDVLLFDGVFLLRPELVQDWDFKIWIDAPFEVTVERAIARDAARGEDVERLRHLYRCRYVPGQLRYLGECRPRERADAVVDNADLASPEVELRRPGGSS